MTASATDSGSAEVPSGDPGPEPQGRTPSKPARVANSVGWADKFMLSLLRLPLEQEKPVAGAEAKARSAFQTSVAISAVRCLITYIFLPFIAPFIGLAARIGEPLGIVVALVAVVSIIASTRRFWSTRHRTRWAYTALGGVMLCFLVFLLATDISNL